jgi:hypothetical protein
MRGLDRPRLCGAALLCPHLGGVRKYFTVELVRVTFGGLPRFACIERVSFTCPRGTIYVQFDVDAKQPCVMGCYDWLGTNLLQISSDTLSLVGSVKGGNDIDIQVPSAGTSQCHRQSHRILDSACCVLRYSPRPSVVIKTSTCPQWLPPSPLNHHVYSTDHHGGAYFVPRGDRVQRGAQSPSERQIKKKRS